MISMESEPPTFSVLESLSRRTIQLYLETGDYSSISNSKTNLRIIGLGPDGNVINLLSKCMVRVSSRSKAKRQRLREIIFIYKEGEGEIIQYAEKENGLSQDAKIEECKKYHNYIMFSALKHDDEQNPNVSTIKWTENSKTNSKTLYLSGSISVESNFEINSLELEATANHRGQRYKLYSSKDGPSSSQGEHFSLPGRSFKPAINWNKSEIRDNHFPSPSHIAFLNRCGKPIEVCDDDGKNVTRLNHRDHIRLKTNGKTRIKFLDPFDYNVGIEIPPGSAGTWAKGILFFRLLYRLEFVEPQPHSLCRRLLLCNIFEGTQNFEVRKVLGVIYPENSQPRGVQQHTDCGVRSPGGGLYPFRLSKSTDGENENDFDAAIVLNWPVSEDNKSFSFFGLDDCIKKIETAMCRAFCDQRKRQRNLQCDRNLTFKRLKCSPPNVNVTLSGKRQNRN
mmetsp:Transcript_33112/g.46227  ORF Transcript_33112/g.46227 Transcript_33112/m.46227 type:complete len:450 (+) Transcript_33112:3-1352(+)